MQNQNDAFDLVFACRIRMMHCKAFACGIRMMHLTRYLHAESE